MNSFTTFSKVLCVISLVCCFIMTIFLANLFGSDFWRDVGDEMHWDTFLTVFFLGNLITAIIHSFWGMLISMAEDIHDILYYTEKSAQRYNGSSTEQAVASDGYQPTEFHESRPYTALRKLQNVNSESSPESHSVLPANPLGNAATPQSETVRPAQTDGTPWTCRNCGENNPGDAKFCGHCGLFR